MFDPADSPHYKVLLVPDDPVTEEVSKELRRQGGDEPPMEWPASTLALCVFSSCTGQWEERAFAPYNSVVLPQCKMVVPIS